jgi:oxygen-independent coproporphyrinogen-3 oxidase
LINISSLDVDHISCYSLTVHENTKFFINKINEPDEEYSRLLYDTAESFLKEKGYLHYEISNWAKPNKHSLHNLTYWKDEQYYGLGLGASGYIKGVRYTNTKNLEEYNAGKYIKEKEYITKEENEEYFIMLNLRTTFGINLKEYHDMFETDFYTKYQKILDNYINEGFLVYDQVNGIIKPTYQGMMILDKIILDLLS